MSITTLLQEALQPAQASLVEKAIADAITQKLNEASIDSATKQAEMAQKSAEEIECLHTHYKGELRKAASHLLKLEKDSNAEIRTAVDAIVKANGEKLELTEHYTAELREAAQMYLAETEHGSLEEMKATVAKYVKEKAELMEHAQAFGEEAFQKGLQEAESIAKEANDQFISESRELFDQLDELAKVKQTLNTIKESFEVSGFSLSEDLAYQGLQEEIEKQQAVNEELQESLKQANSSLLESAKDKAFDTLTEGLSVLQKSKLKNVASVITGDISEYSRTLTYLVESQSGTNGKATTPATSAAAATIDFGINHLNESTQPGLSPNFASDTSFVNDIVSQMKNIKSI